MRIASVLLIIPYTLPNCTYFFSSLTSVPIIVSSDPPTSQRQAFEPANVYAGLSDLMYLGIPTFDSNIVQPNLRAVPA